MPAWPGATLDARYLTTCGWSSEARIATSDGMTSLSAPMSLVVAAVGLLTTAEQCDAECKPLLAQSLAACASVACDTKRGASAG